MSVLFCTVGTFYTTSGLNKLVDVGIHWPFALRLDLSAQRRLEDILVVTAHYGHRTTLQLHLSYALSVIGGWITLLGELGFITIICLPRYRLCFVLSMTCLHVLVYLTQGINFLGSSSILFLCLDYNVWVRTLRLSVSEPNHRLTSLVALLQRCDWTHRLYSCQPCSGRMDLTAANRAISTHRLQAVDENGEVYSDWDAVEQVCQRSPLLWPIALLSKILGLIYLLRRLYHRVIAAG
ncbi:hypothetical protein C2W62_39690 [Candidatus Entotheonella serta]|nr:hypothetical protein C2W62_39690 [Candidatus Entotheonella serta]